MPTVVDLRSDTVTRPTLAMRQAMMAAPLGDDVFGDDPTVHELQDKVARLLGKEAAILVPSGTMANQLALRIHTRHGDEAIVHGGCHILNFEGGAAAALSGLTLRPVDSADGSLDPARIAALLHGDDDPHLSLTRLICIENTHNACGGRVVPQAGILEVAALARSRGIALHLDGARLLNAQVASGRAAVALAKPFDTVSLCLSKGLGAPIGSVLAGSTAHIHRARRVRKMLGGGMRQAGLLAAAGIHALDHHVDRLGDDHRLARHFAQEIAVIPGIHVDLATVETNIVFFLIDPSHPAAREGVQGPCRVRGVLLSGGALRARAVTHLDVDEAGVERAVAVLRDVMAGR